MSDEERLQKLRTIAGRYEIKNEFITKLRQLEAFEIFIVADDSGSMATVLMAQSNDPYAKAMTRWDELCKSVSIIIELASCFDKSGVDVYFLNRAPMLGVTSAEQVKVAFAYPPQGYTPIVRTLNTVLAANRQKFGEKKCLLVLLTDGEPTDDHGIKDLKNFKAWMTRLPKSLHVSLVACTDNEQDVKHLSKHAHDSGNCCVLDDYRTEQKKVGTLHNPNELKQVAKSNKGRSLTFGDYIVKILLGSIDNDIRRIGQSECSIQ